MQSSVPLFLMLPLFLSQFFCTFSLIEPSLLSYLTFSSPQLLYTLGFIDTMTLLSLYSYHSASFPYSFAFQVFGYGSISTLLYCFFFLFSLSYFPLISNVSFFIYTLLFLCFLSLSFISPLHFLRPDIPSTCRRFLCLPCLLSLACPLCLHLLTLFACHYHPSICASLWFFYQLPHPLFIYLFFVDLFFCSFLIL